jgi:hypothetical protein
MVWYGKKKAMKLFGESGNRVLANIASSYRLART